MDSNQDSLSANKRALLKIRELKQELANKAETAYEPIAVVSMACRFPRHADTPERFWEQLISKESFVRDIPESRWDQQAFFDDDPDVPGKMYTQKGVYLDDIDQMDPDFFGVSPREATWVDPQQRLLMEVSWEAIERAGWIPEKVGDSTGVFVGWMHNDYQNEASDSFLNLNPYIATGAAGSFLCGRLAYYLGMRGPALAVDTACSSSLVALHLAIQSLQKKECDQALVGGVNVICSPTTNILTCKLKALSREGHSRAFDAAADGYLRGEGCGVVALRRLSDAQKSNDRILGIIRGSAVGHNGFSSGLTAPNPKAQEQVIRQALDRAGCDAEQVVYLEAHGTGTELGDPLEVQAASAALCKQRDPANPLWIGSVKTNIGHLEAAAGMAGLIKVLLAMQHQQIPGQLNFEEPNPHIPWDSAAVEVLKEERSWPEDRKRIAGISAFGMSGTNAHVVVEAPEKTQPASRSNEKTVVSEKEAGRPGLLVVSAKNEEALFTLAKKYAEELEQRPGDDLSAICRASQVERSHFDYRAAVVCRDPSQSLESLLSIARGQPDDWSVVGHASKRFKLVWQFTGQGSQYTGMGAVLYQKEPVFRRAVDQCREWSNEIQNEDLTEVLFHDPEKIHDTRWTQPGIFAIQMGLVSLLEDWGVRPDLVLGHSVGQYAAACAAGILSWRDGFHLISERGRLISQLPREGKMLAVFARAEEVEAKVGDREGVSVGAYNVSHVVVSGESKAVDAIERELQADNIRSRPLQTSHAFHSGLMDPVLDAFASFAEPFEYGKSTIPLVCNLSGDVLPPDFGFTGRYWSNHIRGAVQFEKSLSYVKEYGADAILELGPRPVLTGMANAMGLDRLAAVTSCLDPKQQESESLQLALATLYSKGLNPDFEKWSPGNQGEHVNLPTYPFQRKRYWGPDKPRAAHAEHHTALPLLGSQLPLANVNEEKRFEVFVDANSPAWIADHQVMGATVMPGAALVELALEATRKGTQAVELIDLRFESPMRIENRTALQTIVRSLNDSQSESSNQKYLECYSRNESLDQWTRHFSVGSGRLVTETKRESIALEGLKERFNESIDVEEFYSFLESIDLNYGQRFQTIRTLRQNDHGVLARLEDETDLKGYQVSPLLLDGAFHSLAVAISRSGEEMFLPVALERLRIYGDLLEQAWCHAEWVDNDGDIRTANLWIYSDHGELLVEIEKLTVRRIERATARKASRSGPENLLYEFQWRPSRLTGKKMEGRRWWIIGSSAGSASKADALRAALTDQGHHCHLIQIQDDRVLLQANGSGAELSPVVRESDQDIDWIQIRKLLHGGSESKENLDGVIWVLNHDGEVGARGSETVNNARGLMSLIQSFRASGIKGLNAGLQLLTENAIATGKDPSGFCVDPRQAQYWGLGRVLSAECPEFRCRMIDIPDNDEGAINSRLLSDVLLTEGEENQIAVRGNECLVPRIAKLAVAFDVDFSVREDRCYLITGGLGKLGRQAARWLVNQGASQVVLVSRRTPDAETQNWIDDLVQTGSEIVVQNLDIGEQPDVNELFDKFGRDWKPLGGLIHAAGVLDDGLIDNQTWPRFEKVLRPKIDASWNLHEASLDHDPDFFVLYSSIASVLGSPGQSNYAMGNGYLDGLAEYRQSFGLPAIAINWGPWTEGMADDERVKKRLAVQGITALEVDEAHAAMELSLHSGSSQSFVIDVDWRKLKLGADGKTPLILTELVTQRPRSTSGDSQLVAKLKKLRPTAQQEFLVNTVQELFQKVLASDAPPEIDRPLIEMGLDSLMAVEFGTELQQSFGGEYEIGPSLLFDHPTILAIAEYLGSIILDQDEKGSETTQGNSEKADSKVVVENASPTEVKREDIAIVGMSCQFPGADSVEEYWNNLLAGVDSVGEIPSDRWDIDKFYSAEREPGKMYTRQGGFRKDIDKFDASFFNISDNEACWIDPQHRMLLENSYHALEDAGIRTKPLADCSVGVFMGIMGQDYAFLPTLDDKEVVQGFEGAGLSHSAGVGRISYLLGFEGPSVAVDTASSSSLVAVIQAVRSLQERNCNLALAGGVNAILAPVNSLLMSKAGLLSPDGRCKSFSEDADGFGRGEGCGVVVLKRLSDAQKDSDRILAVIRGGAIGHNGFTGGLTTPSSKAQVRVIQSAVKDAGISPSDVQYLEAHGTGTEFGDPIEITAAAQVYGKGRPKDKPLVVGSAKANIGHLEAAGGVSGLIKTVLSLHHGVVPPQIHFDTPNKHIPWKRMPVTVPTEKVVWEEDKLELAAVTALGLAGTNAHLVLSSNPEETPGEIRSDVKADGPEEPQQQVLFLSANSKSALSNLLSHYHNYLESPDVADGTRSWKSICYSSGTGRQHFGFRECLVASSTDEAKQLLSQKIALANDSLNCNGAATNESAGDGAASLPESEPKHTFQQQKVFWYFPGNESNSWDDLKELVSRFPGFCKAFEQFDQQFQQLTNDGFSLEEFCVDPKNGAHDLTQFVYLACMAQLWQGWGLEPDVVTGTGVGQWVAGCVADVMSFQDAFDMLFYHCRHQNDLDWQAFEDFLDGHNFYPPNLSLICPVSGEEIAVHRTLGGSYWKEIARNSADPMIVWENPQISDCDWIMSMGSMENLPESIPENARILTSSDETNGPAVTMCQNLAVLYRSGFNPNFEMLYDREEVRKVPLPVYPFERKRYWITEISGEPSAEAKTDTTNGGKAYV